MSSQHKETNKRKEKPGKTRVVVIPEQHTTNPNRIASLPTDGKTGKQRGKK